MMHIFQLICWIIGYSAMGFIVIAGAIQMLMWLLGIPLYGIDLFDYFRGRK
jgi:hypothetical protein